MSWVEGLIRVAFTGGEPVTYNGMRHERGLGIVRRGEDRWLMVHLATGFGVVALHGVNLLEAMVIATEIAEAGDWTFQSLSGWQNQDPQLGSKVQNIVALYAPCVVVDVSEPEPISHQLAMANAVRGH
ncbi:MAG: hypothetical protein E6Q97_27710 [Desulfurellales bacterium]|nr:MAG: hypothetical protein E6Q97_27710 [Desulfurellales bacterium]